jgi:GH15 family glucan-1,4-alpha-glucosidase
MYRDIADYGLIGDMHAVALVSYDGSIDYCSMPHLDSPTIFAALLDDERGGFFKIQPRGKFDSEQEYIKDANILSCTFKTQTGQAKLFDFMPVSTQELFDKEEHIIHRCLKGISGSVDFELGCAPRPQYASKLPYIEKKGNTFKIKTKDELFTLILKIENYEVKEDNSGEIVVHFSLKEGQRAHFDFIYGDRGLQDVLQCSFKDTEKFWHDWLHSCIGQRCSFLAEYTDMVNRSLLTLKLLTFQPTGAIAAAATTSLPEYIGAGRNWDYRFTWIRDASFTLKALFALGHITEADSFIRWLHGVYQRYGSRDIQIMYSLEGESRLKEEKLEHLKGYKNSRPVRIGNNAYKQSQWDIYGEVMDTALRLSDYAGKIDKRLWPFFKDICNLAVQNWRKPDYGIWEVRSGTNHFIYSKVMCWVALDRGIKIARRYGFEAPLLKWEEERNRIKEDILQKGYDMQLDSFVQSYGSKQIDASLLLMPLMNFLPIDDKRIQATIDACKRMLMRNGFLLRYTGEDGLKGEEGAFLLCNFWLVECLVLSGKIDEAKAFLATTSRAANHLGLFSEEYDFKDGQMLGNFPQAFSHIGYINAAYSILNAQMKNLKDKMHTPLSKRLQRLIPSRVILNKTDTIFTVPPQDIAAQLKVSLSNLQGAFFNVSEGRVNYEAMRKSESYQKYLQLAKRLNYFDPYTLKGDDEKKAFWINIYNIIIIHGVIELDIINSVKEVFNFFGRVAYTISGLSFTADDIEHGILRGNRQHPVSNLKLFSWFDKRKALCINRIDPRVHFTLVCASSSCPPIEFYDAQHIDNQLNIAGKSFINRKGLILDKKENVVYLSQVFKWYARDFGKDEKEVLEYAVSFADEKTKSYVFNNIDKIKLMYLPYDWNLNRVLE